MPEPNYAAIRSAIREMMVRVVADTLRYVAQGPSGLTPEEAREMADEVERLQEDDPTCPVCQETICDQDCPLSGTRKWT